AALRMSGARDEAYREATKMISGTTDSCAARAMLAGLKQERGETQAARELVAPALRAAAGPGVMPSTLRCGVLSAAAIGDAPEAAALLRQIAGDERMLRAWAAEIIGTTGSKSLRRGMFPWTHVNDRAEMAAARAELDGAYRREREVAKAALEGLP